jgi:hypothetical protein
MSDVAEVASLLRNARDRLDVAGSSIATARAGAKTIEAGATAVGFLGIAAGMRQLEELISRVRQMQMTTAGEVNAAAAGVEQTPADRRPAEVISTLSTVLQQIATASDRLGVISRTLGTATAQTNRSLMGGLPGRMLWVLGEVERAVRDAAASLAAAKTHAEDLVAEAAALGNFTAIGGSAARLAGGDEALMSERLGHYTADHLARVTDHLARSELDPFRANDIMLERIERAISRGRPLTESQVYFMRHELLEAELMDGRMDYPAAHAEALKTHPPGRNYDVDVIDRFEEFGLWWRKMNGLGPR